VEYLKAVCGEFGVELDESQLQGPEAIVSVAPSLSVGPEDQAAALAAGGVKTKAGFVIPPLTVPRDELEMRLMLLKRE
jgi:vacuolar protein sorting-associated protein IST1